jgi:sodium/bile acid cotransporter 7
MIPFVKRHWFLLSLLSVLAAGLLLAPSLERFAKAPRVRNLIVMITMFVVTLPVENASLRRAVRRPWPALLASLMSLVALPLFAWALMPLLRSEFALGLVVVAVTPGTIASSAVWTRRADGNEMVPILVTVITNLFCFVVTPFWLFVIADREGTSISFVDMSIKLFMFVVLPMVAGQLARKSKGVARWADGNRPLLSVIAQCGILSIVLVGGVQCGLHLRLSNVSDSVSAWDFGWLAILLASLFTVMFFIGMWLARSSRMSRGDAIGVGFSGSQKTLMVGLQVGLFVGGGLVIVPMVMYHFLQLVIGTYFADRLREAGAAEQSAEEER